MSIDIFKDNWEATLDKQLEQVSEKSLYLFSLMCAD